MWVKSHTIVFDCQSPSWDDDIRSAAFDDQLGASISSVTDSGRSIVNTRAFEIVVNGTLSPPLIAALDGFTVERIEDGQTYLVGQVPDQARLLGMLDMLRDLTIELVSVKPIDQI